MIERPLPWREAIDVLRRRLPQGSKRTASEWSKEAQVVKDRAFFSAQVESTRFLARARKFLLDFIEHETENTPEGIALRADGRARFVNEMAEFAIREGLGPVGIPADAVDQTDITDIRSEARLRLIFDTQTRQSVGYGWYKQGLDPEILEAWPAARFIRYPGSKTYRPRHARHEGDIRLKTDNEYWALYQNAEEIGGFETPYEPYGFNSNMGQEDVSREEAIQVGLIKESTNVSPPKKTPSFNDNLRASLNGIDPDLRAQLAKELGVKTPRKRDYIKPPKSNASS